MIQPNLDIDPRTLPAYTYAEGSRILHIPASTIQAWKRDTSYSYKGEKRTFQGPLKSDRPGLSYNDLVELFILRALRNEEGVPLHKIRVAREEAEQHYGITDLFLHEDFRFAGHDLFLDRLGMLVSLTPGQQLAMRTVLEGYLKRLRYDSHRLVFAFYPVIPGANKPNDTIIVHAQLAFGRPVVERLGIRASAIVSRINAGESAEHVIEDYGLVPEEFDEAILIGAA